MSYTSKLKTQRAAHSLRSFAPLAVALCTLPLMGCMHDEIGVHLGCGLPVVTSVEWMPWLCGLFANPPALERGRLVPPPGPGLGLELHADNVAKWKAG